MLESKSRNERRDSKHDEETSELPTEILHFLESSDRKASKLRISQLSTDSLPKSHAAQSQIKVQTHLMECRILLQNALTSRPRTISESEVDAEENSESNKANKDVEHAASRLLIHLMEARKMLFPEETNLDDDTLNDADKNRDSEYSGEGMKSYSNFITNSQNTHLEKKLNDEYDGLESKWKSILNRRHTSLRLYSGNTLTSKSSSRKANVIDQSFWSQVESTLQHDVLLHSFTQTEQNTSQDATSFTSLPLFDDSKVYRHMLQDFITQSTERHHSVAGTVADAAAERLKRVADKKRRSEVDVDRKASKGKKIRYMVHEKLTNFTFPVPRPEVHVAMDEDVLFKSMFGGVKQRRSSS